MIQSEESPAEDRLQALADIARLSKDLVAILASCVVWCRKKLWEALELQDEGRTSQTSIADRGAKTGAFSQPPLDPAFTMKVKG
jgi:hypothetical protein